MLRYCAVGAIILGVLSGCAGKSPARVEASKELPQEVASDLQHKFEVVETQPVAPKPTPTPAVTVPQGKAAPAQLVTSTKHSKKKLKGKAVTTALTEPDSNPTSEPTPVTSHFKFPNRRPSKEPIWVGERFVYEIKYIGLPAGTFTLTTLPFKYINGRRVYHFRGDARSSKVFSLIYRVNDYAETFVDFEGFFSHRFHYQLDQTKQTRDALELFDSEKKQAFYWNRWNRKDHPYEEKKEFHEMIPFPQDTLSSLIYLRSVEIPTGSSVSFPVISEGKPVEAVVTAVERQNLDTPLGKVRTVKLRPDAQTRGVMTKQGDSFMWLTDDDRRILVRLEAKIRIGTIVAELKEADLGTPP